MGSQWDQPLKHGQVLSSRSVARIRPYPFAAMVFVTLECVACTNRAVAENTPSDLGAPLSSSYLKDWLRT